MSIDQEYFPIGERFLVELEDLGEVSEGGIIIPAQSREVGRRARVLTVGNGPLTSHGVRIPLQVKPGDTVLLHMDKWRNFDVPEKDGRQMVIIEKEEHVMAIVLEKSVYQPVSDRVIVRRVPMEKETSGGIAIPSRYQNFNREAVVLAVGPGRITDDGKRIPCQVKPGDRVIMYKQKGLPIENQDKDGEVCVLRETDLMAIVKEKS
jgi:chaperonin GroES